MTRLLDLLSSTFHHRIWRQNKKFTTPLSQITCRFDFSVYISFVVYLDINIYLNAEQNEYIKKVKMTNN
jgi:hypothetical protein